MQNKTLFILTSFLIMLTTFAYSALATNLAITGEANFRVVSDIRVTNITLDSVENGATQYFDSKYTKDTITTGFILPNVNSSISYNVEITNKGTIDEAIYDLQTISSNNEGIIILIDNKPIDEALPIIVPFGTSKTIKITYKTSQASNNVINIVNKFIFKEVYYVEYNSKGGSSVETQIKYKDVDLTLEGKPTKNKYVFTGWSESENSTLVRYIEGSTYTLNENKTLYAVYRQGVSTFVDGKTFNARIKILAGNNNATYETLDSYITSIQRASSLPSSWIVNGKVVVPSENNIVSTQTSDFPIYAWYDNTVIYYYTDVDNPYMNSDASYMFNKLSNVTNIGLNTIDTSKVTDMAYLFYYCRALTNIDLSNFNTSSVTNMASMFADCNKLTTLDLSNFDTSSVADMNNMFSNCISLKSLDLSSFDMSNVTDTTNLLYGLTNLQQLKTPKTYPSNLSITLSKTMYDASNNAYTSLSKTSPSKTWIKIGYTVVFNKNDNNATGEMSDQKIGVDATTNLQENTYINTGYRFIGWNTKEDGTGEAYLDKAQVTNLKSYDESITLYAQWMANTYTVIFNKNNNNATGEMSNQTFTYGTSKNLTANAYKLTNYKFVGWNTKEDESGTTYTDAQSVSNLVSTNNGTITLFAMWRRVMAENIEHENNDLNCTDAQCVIDELYYMLY